MTTEPGIRGLRGRWWQSGVYARKRPYLEARARITAAVRQVFAERGFLEVDTPALQVSPGLEPHLVAFATELRGPHPDDAQRLYLHTSPEFAMKKLLAAGLERIFQLSHVFRNAERSATHHPEFSMIEWYRAGEGYRTLIDDCRALFQAAARAAGRDRLSWRGQECDPFAEWRVLTVQEAFLEFTGIDLLATAPDPLNPDLTLLNAATTAIGIPAREGDRWDDLFFRVFLERIEPRLGLGSPCVLTEYPVSMAALSRPNPADPRTAERFELYVAGLELANAFGELTDAAAQQARFEADMDLKQQLYGVRYPIDEDFLAALDPDRGGGLPDCSGIALGFDRLVMLATGADHIDDVLWAPVIGTMTTR
ncbi:EF-P lysine aminoacylase EpmA [Inquilinus sp. Marseille-Q2685]|uniref:EF-P lysine aminoacylase EpmA n=1 Tax=Inquilinus sp. Marseille-Q2685 TaxID=2866581 RepID=UPI001CE449A2|nr:EF-P lysine aminoacylase EpmA [Inquilinus sp. Marseille-Q2685]